MRLANLVRIDEWEWSPDSERIAFGGADGRFYVADASGGGAFRVPNVSATGVNPSWLGPYHIVRLESPGLVIFDVERGERVEAQIRGGDYFFPNYSAVLNVSVEGIVLRTIDGSQEIRLAGPGRYAAKVSPKPVP